MADVVITQVNRRSVTPALVATHGPILALRPLSGGLADVIETYCSAGWTSAAAGQWTLQGHGPATDRRTAQQSARIRTSDLMVPGIAGPVFPTEPVAGPPPRRRLIA